MRWASRKCLTTAGVEPTPSAHQSAQSPLKHGISCPDSRTASNSVSRVTISIFTSCPKLAFHLAANSAMEAFGGALSTMMPDAATGTKSKG
ncbi:MAG: hypothetical protein BWY85_00744 [Firmicutes bacterium ADurb.Bin506]|nr:MAG: hypothetical protein BWY85_00744 [Firmicutes bacterium ADurb.Bin506]